MSLKLPNSRNFILLLILVFTSVSLHGQCLSEGGIGAFEMNNLVNDWWNATEGKATFSLSSSEAYTGSQSLQVDVTTGSSWEIRALTNSCNISFTQDLNYYVRFYAKGDVGDEITVTSMAGWGNDMASSTIALMSTDWTLYEVALLADETSATGKVRFNFINDGTYFLDEVTIEEGEAFVLESVDLTNPNIVFEGVNETEFTGTGSLRTWRFNKDYATNESAATYGHENASSSAGVKMMINTASPTVQVDFEEEINWTGDNWGHIAVYQNGVFHSSSANMSLLLENTTGSVSEWSFYFPVYSQINLAELRIQQGYSLEPMAQDKPVYVAIGNSITMGVGLNSNKSDVSYARLVAEDQGFELYNWGIGGSAISSEVIENFSNEVSPSLITVLWGYNDAHFYGAWRWDNVVLDEYTALMDSLCRRFPSSKVMAILPIYSDNETSTYASITELRTNQLSIIQSLQNNYGNLCFIYGDDFITETGHLQDGIHPNDLGNSLLAQGILGNLNNCSFVDCHGDENGAAYYDNCDVCVGGNTGLTACETDCHGDAGGTAFLDDCGVCVGGNTGISPCDNTQPLGTCKGKWLGNIFREAYWSGTWEPREDFSRYWNQVTPGNAGKWGTLEPNRDDFRWASLDTMYNFCERNDFIFKQHVFVWGNQEPNWIGGLTEEEVREEWEEYISTFATRYPNTAIVEVANESILSHAPPSPGYVAALGGYNDGASNPYLAAHAADYGPFGTGWDYIIYAAAKAREYFPEAILLINDYGIISNTSNIATHLEIAGILQDRGLIDAIGFQGHQFNVDGMTANQMENNLNALSYLGLPIHVTELDISGMINGEFSDKAVADAKQLERFQELFPVMWEHPNVAGITMWNYVEGETWRDNNIWLLESDGTERPAMVWLKEYMASQLDVCGQDCESPDLGGDMTLCDGEALTLETTLEETDREFTWYQNGTLVLGASSSSLQLTETGDYLVKVNEGGCINYDDVKVTEADLAECVINDINGDSGNGVYLFPNPMSTALHVTVNFKSKGEVLDAAGRSLQNIELTRGENDIRLENLPPGVYTLRIEGEKRTEVIKFVKQ